MTDTDAARLAAYEKTGLEPEEIQEVVDTFERELGASGAEIPTELKSWMERATFHVRKCAELEKENERLRRFGDVSNELKERATPEKILYAETIDGMYGYLCPRCHEIPNDGEIRNFCAKCGQALDWSEPHGRAEGYVVFPELLR